MNDLVGLSFTITPLCWRVGAEYLRFWKLAAIQIGPFTLEASW